jgi:hypothetical protein
LFFCIYSGENADPGSSAPGAWEGNKKDEVADPVFVATTGLSNITQHSVGTLTISNCVQTPRDLYRGEDINDG